jgi:LmeA-like phospholipid-binding
VRKLGVVLAVILALLVAGDIGLRLWSEAWIARRIDESLGLPTRPQVDLHGFPFALQVARAELEVVEVSVEDLRAQGLSIEEVRLELRDVRFPRGRLFSRGPGRIKARAGEGTVTLAEGDVTTYLRARGLPIDVSFQRAGVRVSTTVSVGGLQIDASATGTLAVSNGTLVYRPQEIEVAEGLSVPLGAFSFEIPLPRPAPGITFQRVEVRDGTATVSGRLSDVTIRLEG